MARMGVNMSRKSLLGTAYGGGHSLESMVRDCWYLKQDPDIQRVFIKPTFFSDGSYDLSVCFEVIEGIDPLKKGNRFWYEFLGVGGE